MRKKVIKAAGVGMSFTGIALGVVEFIGFNWTGLTVLMYLYVMVSVTTMLVFELESLGFFQNLVLVVEGEHLEMKKLLTGEKYRVKGELEKL